MTDARHRYAARRDAVEPELVKIARGLGVQWLALPPLDGWVLFRGRWVPVEIKATEREGLEHEYTPAQQRFLRFCREHNAPVWTWRTMVDVMRDLGARITA